MFIAKLVSKRDSLNKPKCGHHFDDSAATRPWIAARGIARADTATPHRQMVMIDALIAGGAAGTAVDVALFPLDTIKTRLQDPRGFRAAGGFGGIYRGLLSAALGSAPGAALFFGTYETAKARIARAAGVRAGLDAGLDGPAARRAAAVHMAAASLGEVVACLVRVPTENVKQKLQAGHYARTGETVRAIARAGVLRGFYAGYGTTVLREIPFSVIQFPLYEINKRFVRRWKGGVDPSPFEAALCGSAAGGIAAAATTPVDVVKTRLMLGADAQGVPYKGTVETFRRVVAEGGPRALFAGVVPRTGWIMVGGAVFFGVYEGGRKLLRGDDDDGDAVVEGR